MKKYGHTNIGQQPRPGFPGDPERDARNKLAQENFNKQYAREIAEAKALGLVPNLAMRGGVSPIDGLRDFIANARTRVPTQPPPPQQPSRRSGLFGGSRGSPAPQQPSGLRSVPMSLTQQQAQYDQNMQQAQSLPPAERAKFSEQFQRAAAAGDKSTIRPGTVFGDASGISSLKSPNAMAGNIGRLSGSLLGGLTQTRPSSKFVGNSILDSSGKKIGAVARPPQPTVPMARQSTGMPQKSNLGTLTKATMKKGGAVKKKASATGYKSGGSVSSASKRADGCVIKGKTKGKVV